MNKAIFLDRDGTINVEKHYLYRIEDWEFLPGVLDALRLFQEKGYWLFILTNQSGIARGYFTERDYWKLDNWLKRRLAEEKIEITGTYYCPHHPEAKVEEYRRVCTCRKPGLGMFRQAVKEYNIDLSQSYAIGDKIRDLAICDVSDCQGYLIGTNEEATVIDAVKAGNVQNVQGRENLLCCAIEICAE